LSFIKFPFLVKNSCFVRTVRMTSCTTTGGDGVDFGGTLGGDERGMENCKFCQNCIKMMLSRTLVGDEVVHRVGMRGG
jgi:hypothetical protein